VKPTSLPSRLLALTPQGRRLFALLAEQQAEIARLREQLRVGQAAGTAAPDAQKVKAEVEAEVEALRALLRGAEAELEYLHAVRE
jgi:uncharacterized protein (DUF305 family)